MFNLFLIFPMMQSYWFETRLTLIGNMLLMKLSKTLILIFVQLIDLLKSYLPSHSEL